jgi:hypothetical protein
LRFRVALSAFVFPFFKYATKLLPPQKTTNCDDKAAFVVRCGK